MENKYEIDCDKIKPTGTNTIYFTEEQLINSLHLFEGLEIYTLLNGECNVGKDTLTPGDVHVCSSLTDINSGEKIILGSISNIIYENGKLYTDVCFDPKLLHDYYKLCLCWDVDFDLSNGVKKTPTEIYAEPIDKNNNINNVIQQFSQL